MFKLTVEKCFENDQLLNESYIVIAMPDQICLPFLGRPVEDEIRNVFSEQREMSVLVISTVLP